MEKINVIVFVWDILVILAAFFAHKYKIIKLDKSFAIFVSLLGIIGLLISIIVKMNNYIKINKNIQCNLQNMNINESGILKNSQNTLIHPIWNMHEYIDFYGPLLSKYCLVEGVLFYLPNLPQDTLQRHVWQWRQFFEEGQIDIACHYLPKKAVIIDIGANIGNHTMYWASKCDPCRIYAFEPVPETFEILKRNIAINCFVNVKIFNMGLSDEPSHAEIDSFFPENIGATVIKKSEKGTLQVEKLDNIKIEENRVDFIKIDVEGHELLVLKGAIETLKKYKPVIFIEMFEPNFEAGNKILIDLGYELKENLGSHNYVYVHKYDNRWITTK